MMKTLNDAESKNTSQCNQQNNGQESSFNTNYDDTKVINVNTLIKKKKKPIIETQEQIKEASKDSLITLNLKEDLNENISPERIVSTKDVSPNAKDKYSDKHVLNLDKKLEAFSKLSRDDLSVIDEADDDIKIETISKKL